jgi:hypothetical protein
MDSGFRDSLRLEASYKLQFVNKKGKICLLNLEQSFYLLR